jgi:UDPglucose 6-dehydrogenase
LVKVAANAFLATKISFINAMAEVCEAAGADVTVLAEASGHDDRIGHRFLRAGLGFGGGCLPKDIRAFMARAGELGVDEALMFLREVDAINLRRRDRTVDMARELVGGSLLGVVVACLGASFKPNSDDVRDSPALHVAASLQTEGATVRVYDPVAMDNASRFFPTLHFAESVDDAVSGADIVMLLTEWDEFSALTPDRLDPLVRSRRLVDARNVFDPVQWRAAGWTIRSLGRP